MMRCLTDQGRRVSFWSSFFIVIRLDDQGLRRPHALLHEFGRHAEIGEKTEEPPP